ncbi:uncharacterized protein LOC130384011 [Gadus chalcogrammus]|uniref:uncharacterized protein LOC130384011 n=1 Tax=Gadus chalcogrammus TaxID=1042646 RepID=UPI0024C2EAC4|nr:uncharacterized protein LOC130384011 [Gadus chalcogrammus]
MKFSLPDYSSEDDDNRNLPPPPKIPRAPAKKKTIPNSELTTVTALPVAPPLFRSSHAAYSEPGRRHCGELTGPTFILPPPPQHPATFFNSIDAELTTVTALPVAPPLFRSSHAAYSEPGRRHCGELTGPTFILPPPPQHPATFFNSIDAELTTVTALPVAPPLFRSSHAAYSEPGRRHCGELTGPTFILPPPPQHPATFFNSIDAELTTVTALPVAPPLFRSSHAELTSQTTTPPSTSPTSLPVPPQQDFYRLVLHHLRTIEEELKEVKQQVAVNTAMIQRLGGGGVADLGLVEDTNMPLSNAEDLDELHWKKPSVEPIKKNMVWRGGLYLMWT